MCASWLSKSLQSQRKKWCPQEKITRLLEEKICPGPASGEALSAWGDPKFKLSIASAAISQGNWYQLMMHLRKVRPGLGKVSYEKKIIELIVNDYYHITDSLIVPGLNTVGVYLWVFINAYKINFFQSLQPEQSLLYLKIHEQAVSPSRTLYLCFINNIDVRSWFIIERES